MVRKPTPMRMWADIASAWDGLDYTSQWIIWQSTLRLARGVQQFGEWRVGRYDHTKEVVEELVDAVHYALALIVLRGIDDGQGQSRQG